MASKGLGFTYPAADSTDAVAHYLDSTAALSTGAELLAVRNAGTDKFVLGSSGEVRTGEWEGTVVDEVYGGTGLAGYAAGDLLYASSSSVLAKLAVGGAGNIVRSDGSSPAWSTLTVVDTVARGDILHASAANTVTGLTVGGASTVLVSDGTDPSWSTLSNAHISATAEIAVSKLADGAARQVLQTDAAGTGVEWTNDLDLPGTLDVTGAATLDSTLTVTGVLTAQSHVALGDDDELRFGAAPDYWFAYDATATAFEFTTTDADGIGTNGIVFKVEDGTDDVDFTGTITLGSALAVTSGGTGLATATAGDLLYASGANTWASLAKGTGRQLLQMNAGATAPEWASNIDVPGTLDVTGAATLDSTIVVTGGFAGDALPDADSTRDLGSNAVRWANGFVDTLTLTNALAVTSGGTGLATVASGDVLYGSAANTLAALTKGSDGQVLTLASGLPSWADATGGSFGDDEALNFGAGTDYWHIYDSTGTQYRFRSTNVDGAGADGDVFTVQDGGAAIAFAGGITASAGLTVADGQTMGWGDAVFSRVGADQAAFGSTSGLAATKGLLLGTSTPMTAGEAGLKIDVASGVNAVVQMEDAGAKVIRLLKSTSSFGLIIQEDSTNLLTINATGMALGTTTLPSGATKVLTFGDNAGDPTMGTNTAGIYAKDVAGTVEMFAVDEGDVASQISPHDSDGYWVLHDRVPARFGESWRTMEVERALLALLDHAGLHLSDYQAVTP